MRLGGRFIGGRVEFGKENTTFAMFNLISRFFLTKSKKR
jgi:hypothetical protein